MFYDSNDIQLSTNCDEVMNEDTAMKYKAWGWHVITINGNDCQQIRQALDEAKTVNDRPVLIIGKCVMGKGARKADNSNFENSCKTHGAPLGGDAYKNTILNLGGNLKFIGTRAAVSGEVRKAAETLSGEGKTPLLFSKDGKLLGMIAVADTIKEDSEERFTPLRMNPQTSWNYAVAPDAPARAVKQAEGHAYPFDEPPVTIEVAAKKVYGAFEELDQERYTPRIPLFSKTSETTETIRLVPMGATETRLTAFPDGQKRTMLPILSGYTAEGVDLEKLEFMAFRDIAQEIRIDRDGYFDLAGFYRKSQNCSAYLQIRFYSEYEGTGIASVMMSDGGTGWIDGKKVLEIPAIMEAEFAAGLWFEIPVKKGHNHLVLKVDDTIPTYDHRDAWGAKVQFFI
jgi:hypothetical protein